MNQYFVVSITQGGTFDIVVQQSQPIVVSISQNTFAFTPENVANKSLSIVTDQASNIKYPSVKAVYDWATSVFTTASAVASQIAAALVGYATETWVQSQGYLTSIPTLQDVTDAGNTTTNDIEFGSGAGVYFNNGARVVEGTTDAGQGGNKGVALKCSIDYEYKWEGGRLYVMEQNGTTIRATLYNFTNVPSATDDSTKGFVVGSRWFLDNGDFYLCTDNTAGAAVWVLKAYAVPNLQQVTDSGNTTTNTINVDAVAFDLTPTAAPGHGQIAYNAATGALAYQLDASAVTNNLGQQLHAYVHNADSVTITKGQAVYLFSASGNKASVKLANNTSDATSAKTFGLAAEDIAPNNNGFVICQGVLDGLNLGAYNAGDTLYLGATAGSYTAVKPYAPNHLVYIGIVERANNGNGQIYVRVQNGYELDEIHDVDLISVAPVNNDVLTYVTGSPNLWKPRSIGTILGYTPVNPTRNIATSSPLSGGGDLSADRTISIADAAADGTTKGAATFTANDFNSAAGVISLDYTNGQSASAVNKGFLTAADWSTFNGKQDNIIRLVKAGSNQTTTAATAQNITELVTANLEANKVYYISGLIRIGCNNTGGVLFGITVPTGASAILSTSSVGTSATNFQHVTADQTGLSSTGIVRVNSIFQIPFYGRVTMGATIGNVQITFASAVAGQTSTIYGGNQSMLTFIKLN